MIQSKTSGISVLVPVFGATDSLIELVSRVDSVLNDSYEIILIDDGSSSETWSVIESLANTKVKGIRLARNSGQHSALLAGLRNAKFPIVITLDDDLQNPPEEIPLLLEALGSQVDVVYGTSDNPSHSQWRLLTSKTSKKLMRRFLKFIHATQLSAFRAFRTSLREGFDVPLGPSVSIDALLSWTTTRITSVNVNHHKRKFGTSNYNFRKLLKYLFDTVTGFSSLPLRLATGIGFITIFFSLGTLVWVLFRPIFSSNSVAGFPFLAATIAIFSGTQLLVLGILGQYIGHMHFRVMNKPSYVIAEQTYDFGD